MTKRQTKRDAERKLSDEARLLRDWLAWHRDERKVVLAGPHGPRFERLLYILRALELKSATVLLAFVRGIDWTTIHTKTGLIIVHEITPSPTFAPVTGCRHWMTAGPMGARAPSSPSAVSCFPRKRRRLGRSPVR